MRKMLLAFCFPLVLAGCGNLARLDRENIEMEQNIAAKEQVLANLETEQRILEEEKKRLAADLNSKQMAANELYARLDKVKRQNARIKASTNDQQKKKENLERQIQGYQDEINALNNNKQLSTAEKQRKIEALRKEIRKYLELGL